MLAVAILLCPPVDLSMDWYERPEVDQPEAKVEVTAQPTPTPAKTAAPAPKSLQGASVAGVATWYDWRNDQGAAGPRLRSFLGKGWRGDEVSVCPVDRGPVACVEVTLTDWCACPGGRVIDLDDQSFKALAPLDRGVIKVKVSRTA